MIDRLTALAHQVDQQTQHALQDFRAKQLAFFLKQGLPTRKDEAWRYTNLADLVQHEFELSKPYEDIDSIDIQPWVLGNTHRFVFVDGYFSPELSDLQHLPKEIIRLKTCPTSSSSTSLSHFAALNGALFVDGVHLEIPKNIQLNSPIHMLHISTQSHTPRMQHLRHFLSVKENSDAVVFEEYVSTVPSTVVPNFVNVVTQIDIDAGASLQHYKLQRDHERSIHIAHTDVNQHSDSAIKMYNVTIGASLSRGDLVIHLSEKGVVWFVPVAADTASRTSRANSSSNRTLFE